MRADEAPEPPADPVSRPGDLWACGQHRVLCGDATVLSDVEAVLGGELADVYFTDPPYNVNYANGSEKSEVAKRWVIGGSLWIAEDLWGAALQADGETRSVVTASSIRRRSAGWTILLD